MTRSAAWLAYFRGNASRPSPPLGSFESLPPHVRAALVPSLQRFQLGETGEGRVAHEAARSADPALDDALKECIALYVREEGRHARELAAALRALGAPLAKHDVTEALFRRGRRLLGLRTKLLTMAVAEIVGGVYYDVLAAHVPPVAETARAIRRDEDQHLAFQAELFGRVVAGAPTAYVAACAAGFALVVACAIATVLVTHAPLFRATGASRTAFARACVREALRGAERVRANAAGARHERHAVTSTATDAIDSRPAHGGTSELAGTA
jgi:hypothetical protein